MNSIKATMLAHQVAKRYPQYSGGEAYWAAKELPQTASLRAVVARIELDRALAPAEKGKRRPAAPWDARKKCR